MFCSLWGVLDSAGLSPPLFPAKSVQDEDELVPKTLQPCHTSYPVLIISLAGTLTGLSRGPFPMAGRAELREFQSSLLFSKLANELQLQMVFFTGPCQHASHTARSRNCCFLQNEFSIYKICSDSGVHYVLACFAPATCLACNTRQTSSSSPLPPWPGSADEAVGISPGCSVPDHRDWG